MRTLFLIFAIAFLASFLPLLFLFLRGRRKHRGPRVIVCPETRAPAAVEVDARRAAWTEIFGEPEFRLQSCSRWPEREDCGQQCLAQIEAAPEGCLARSILARWYEGSSCALCGRPIGSVGWLEHRPALLGPDERTLGWGEVDPVALPQVLSTHRRICWDCHVAETFRAKRPELVVEDPWHEGRRPPPADSRLS